MTGKKLKAINDITPHIIPIRDMEYEEKFVLVQLGHTMAKNQIRQSAIEWIKCFETQSKYGPGELIPANPNLPPMIIMEFSLPNQGLINWIKHFFNITVEELK